MKTFDLPAQSRLRIVKATPRKETHGKEKVQAISLRLEWWPTDNEALNLLHAGMQDMLFWTPPEVAQQCALEGIPTVKKHRRVPTAAMPIKVEASFSGYTLTIEHGIDDSTALELYACAMDKFECEAKEGGSSCIRWSLASNKTITPELIGALCSMEGVDVVATLYPPVEQPTEPVEPIDGTRGPDAGDLFAAEHGGPEDGGEPDSEGGEADAAAEATS